MTEAMPFLRKVILLSYDPRPFEAGSFIVLEQQRRPYFLRGSGALPASSKAIRFCR